MILFFSFFLHVYSAFSIDQHVKTHYDQLQSLSNSILSSKHPISFINLKTSSLEIIHNCKNKQDCIQNLEKSARKWIFTDLYPFLLRVNPTQAQFHKWITALQHVQAHALLDLPKYAKLVKRSSIIPLTSVPTIEIDIHRPVHSLPRVEDRVQIENHVDIENPPLREENAANEEVFELELIDDALKDYIELVIQPDNSKALLVIEPGYTEACLKIIKKFRKKELIMNRIQVFIEDVLVEAAEEQVTPLEMQRLAENVITMLARRFQNRVSREEIQGIAQVVLEHVQQAQALVNQQTISRSMNTILKFTITSFKILFLMALFSSPIWVSILVTEKLRGWK